MRRTGGNTKVGNEAGGKQAVNKKGKPLDADKQPCSILILPLRFYLIPTYANKRVLAQGRANQFFNLRQGGTSEALFHPTFFP
jgi:hypothetical protein